LAADEEADEGDERPNSTQNRFPIPAWITNTVPISFRMCIAFIAQPTSLVEEGLFRVSGNKTQMEKCGSRSFAVFIVLLLVVDWNLFELCSFCEVLPGGLRMGGLLA
jgi:hypothetical protein